MPDRRPADNPKTLLSRGRALPALLSIIILLLVLVWVAGLNPGRGSYCFAETGDQGAKETASSPAKKSEHTITLYVTSWCPACAMAINYLKQKNIPFTVKDVEKNPDYLKEMVSKIGGYRGVPVVDIDGKAYLGFHPSMVEDLSP
jgi:glutaredoxin 3